MIGSDLMPDWATSILYLPGLEEPKKLPETYLQLTFEEDRKEKYEISKFDL
jgi:hypothetical protein